jgi:hypothetical protein
MSYPDGRIDTDTPTSPVRAPMSREDAMAAILEVVPLSGEDLAGFLACSDDERAALIVAYKDAAVPITKSMWDEVLAILGACAAFANLVMPIANVVTSVYAATKV